jgi:hypothetical protein
MSNIRLINYHYKENKGIFRGSVIRLIAIKERFYPKFKSNHI